MDSTEPSLSKVDYLTAPASRRFLSPPLLDFFRRLSDSRFMQAAAGLSLILVVMSWIEFSGPAILDNDGYYHIRWAAVLKENAPRLPRFTQLPLTTLNERDYVDHHYLFHVFLIPFTAGDMRVGAKLAAAIFSAAGLASLFALLVIYRVPYRWLWLAPLVLSSQPFLYRMSMTRAPALSIVLLGVGSYLILERKLRWLAVLSFVFVWTYSLFPLIVVFAAAHAVAVYLAQRRIDLSALVATVAGVIAGLVVNPYFPKNLTLFWEHLGMKVTAEYSVDVGVEWYPYETWAILESSALAFAIYFAALVAFDFRARARDAKPLFFLIVSLAFLLMAFKSRRFIEYWPPFAMLFAAFALSEPLKRFNRAVFERPVDRAIAGVAGAFVVVVMIITMGLTLWQARASVKAETDPAAYKGASEWIAANTSPGSVIFNTDWDDFPMLYYYNPNNAYVVGLDPTYLYDRDKQLWKLYERITLGNEANPAPLIRERFGAEYVFTDNYHRDFLEIADESGDFETVYKDGYTTVLRIIAPRQPAQQ
ncbi:MAG TPA: hypothetical protein VKA70_20025 [Blastocatellia bacterium]|nr:hypothetical protein [Blastocatellia bacterium]